MPEQGNTDGNRSAAIALFFDCSLQTGVCRGQYTLVAAYAKQQYLCSCERGSHHVSFVNASSRQPNCGLHASTQHFAVVPVAGADELATSQPLETGRAGRSCFLPVLLRFLCGPESLSWSSQGCPGPWLSTFLLRRLSLQTMVSGHLNFQKKQPAKKVKSPFRPPSWAVFLSQAHWQPKHRGARRMLLPSNASGRQTALKRFLHQDTRIFIYFLPTVGFAGIRVGEAVNPGPLRQSSLQAFFGAKSSAGAAPAANTPAAPNQNGHHETMTCRLAVINPTALLGKEDDILSMQQDLYLVSETSAVQRAQQLCTAQLRRSKFHVQWSPPVQAHNSADTTISLRGHAEGTAILSRYPIRPSFSGRPQAWQGSSRLVEAIARIGWLSFRIICIYGFPANREEASFRNDELFRLALQRASSDELPTVFGGDLNVRIQGLSVWEDFRAKGYQELFEFWQARTGEQLPATCRSATRRDTLILPPVFQQFVRSAQVETGLHLFDAHAPLCVQLEIPGEPVLQHRWRMPRSWAHVAPDKQDFARAYEEGRPEVAAAIAGCASKDTVDVVLVTWADQVENAVDRCLRQSAARDPAGLPLSHLPKSFRGRFQFRERLGFPLPSTVKPARQGDYNPEVEVLTIVGKAKVRQARRLRTFAKGLSKARREGTWATAVQKQLANEWQAILRARGYPPSFPEWLLAIAHFDFFWYELPPSEWLEDVVAYVCYDADVTTKAEVKRQQQLRSYCASQDVRANYAKQHFAALRGQMRPAITAIPKTEEQPATKVSDEGFGVALYRLPYAVAFKPLCPARADESEVKILGCSSHPDHAEVLKLQFDRVAPASCCLSQLTEASTGPELHRAFFEYWSPVWIRDKGEARRQPSFWNDFLAHLPPVPECAKALRSLTLLTPRTG